MKAIVLRIVFPMVLAIVAVAGLTQAASAACVLKREPLREDPQCIGLVGYANGDRVGYFAWRGRNVTVGGTCAALHPRGSLSGSNRVSVGGIVRILTDDCRGTM